MTLPSRYLAATSSSRMLVRNYWQDTNPASATRCRWKCRLSRMDSAAKVETIPLDPGHAGVQLDGPGRRTSRQGLYARRIRSHLHAALPQHHRQCRGRRSWPGCKAGQAGTGEGRQTTARRGCEDCADRYSPMDEMFESLAIGLAVAVFIILVLLTAYFQSWRSALISLGRRAGGAQRRSSHALCHGHDAQYRVLHGHDHVYRSVRLQFGNARHFYRSRLGTRSARALEAARRAPPSDCGRF